MQSGASEKKKVSDDEIPFTFDVPKDLKEFAKWTNNRTPQQVSTIIQRIRTCNHPSLNPANKQKLEES